MRILITGAGGLVGGAVARKATELGHDVIRTWNRTRLEPITRAQDLRCDLEDSDAVAALPTDIDTVVHAAARIPAGDWSDAAAASANVTTDRRLLRHFADANFTGRWVYLSTVSLEHETLRISSEYSMGKAEAETSAASAFPGRARSLRISSPYGPGMRHQNVLRLFAEQALAGETITLLGSGERTQDFVHADDIATAVMAAMFTPGGGPLVIASGEPVSMRTLAHLLVGIADSPSVVEHSDRPDPQAEFRADYDIAPAREALGWTPEVRLETGLRTMLEAL